jgi:hypothetical protein
LAVIFSLLYVGIQIRNRRRSDQIVAAANIAAAVDDWIGQIVRDKELYELYRRGFADYESLSQTEKGRYSMLILQFLRSAESVWLQHRMGVVESGFWSAFEFTIGSLVGSAGGTRGFEKNRAFLSPEFVSAVHGILDNQKKGASESDP